MQYPQLHSDLPPSRIEKVIPSPNQIYVLTKDGEVYTGLSEHRASELLGRGAKFQVKKLGKPVLEDGS